MYKYTSELRADELGINQILFGILKMQDSENSWNCQNVFLWNDIKSSAYSKVWAILKGHIWNWARNEKWYKKSRRPKFWYYITIISPIKKVIKISLSSKKWYNDMIVYQWYTIFQCLLLKGDTDASILDGVKIVQI
jgi:hypothetical protein